MNKLLVIYGSVLISGTAIAEDQKSTVYEPLVQNSTTSRSFENKLSLLSFNVDQLTSVSGVYGDSVESEVEMDLEDSSVLYDSYLDTSNEENDAIFDFDSDITAELESEINLGFDTADYLPADFDAYSAPADIHSIDFIEDEEIELGFNTEDYLPSDFNPYEVYFNVHEVEFIEEVFELGYNHKLDLMENFDPYSEVVDIHSIDFIEDEEIELGFDTRPYLPEGFDPYARSN
ncbi:hypothetical protein [Croceivirga thetidis]|uniref:Uncharacterized protein n=1 Tax=Croceivirga thetidis TaxID=2721623 RepID=A0ABX1GPK0_9FLAO|nr:hypothetical protein [Croceivirga thetidis]NKI31837.1 hypothetical protein [Croceivirga thetidis]